MTSLYLQWKAEADRLNDAAKSAGTALQVFPRSPMGLVEDAAKASPEYQAASLAYARAFAAARDFNQSFVRNFRAERAADRAAKFARTA